MTMHGDGNDVTRDAARRSGWVRRVKAGAAIVASALAGGLLGVAPGVHAQDVDGGVLVGCAARSPLLDDMHRCLDDYLSAMDANLADVTAYIERELDSNARAAFETSRQSFAAYRRDNCLWYLAFSSPRDEAELIAKDCLATMSIRRMIELQRLIARNDSANTVLSGYYVYGADRNTFRPCGSEERFWVEGEADVIGALQQQYLAVSTDDRQRLFATLRGELEVGAQTQDEHDGVVRTTAITTLRVPREADCALPEASASAAADARVPRMPVAAANEADAPSSAADPSPVQDEPEQQLLAYFGAWLADCTERPGDRVCLLSTALGAGGGGDGGSALRLLRRAAGRTTLELVLAAREVDSPARLRWTVDAEALGDIVGSTIRADAAGTRQIVDEPAVVDKTLLPLMLAGRTLAIEVLESVDDASGEQLEATLVGLTRALVFADDFVRDGGGL